MLDSTQDKSTEKIRYDSKAKLVNMQDYQNLILSRSLEDFAPLLHNSFKCYYSNIRDALLHSTKVLELGSGCGRHTLVLAESGLPVIATDISMHSLRVLSKVYSGFPNVSVLQCDLERLPFEAESFDLICSAGCLSYGDNAVVLESVFRLLKPGGAFVCIDSLNHNPIYRLNRFFHYLRGSRSKSTLQQMPTLHLLARYKTSSSYFSISYFGALAFLYPILSVFLPPQYAATCLSCSDRSFLKFFAFKFVFTAVK